MSSSNGHTARDALFSTEWPETNFLLPALREFRERFELAKKENRENPAPPEQPQERTEKTAEQAEADAEAARQARLAVIDKACCEVRFLVRATWKSSAERLAEIERILERIGLS